MADQVEKALEAGPSEGGLAAAVAAAPRSSRRGLRSIFCKNQQQVSRFSTGAFCTAAVLKLPLTIIFYIYACHRKDLHLLSHFVRLTLSYCGILCSIR